MVRCGSLVLHAADCHGRNDTLEQAANGPGQADIDLRDAEFGVAVGALVVQIHIVHANHFAAVRVDDLLVEQSPFGRPATLRSGLYSSRADSSVVKPTLPGATDAI
jgi:hypothetical protein